VRGLVFDFRRFDFLRNFANVLASLHRDNIKKGRSQAPPESRYYANWPIYRKALFFREEKKLLTQTRYNRGLSNFKQSRNKTMIRKSYIVPLFCAVFLISGLPLASVHSQETKEASASEAPTTQETAKQETQNDKKQEWIQLFNGKDLTGWTPKVRGHKLGDNYADTFRVVDGCLTVSYDKYKPEDYMSMDNKNKADFDKFGHIFYNEAFSHYLLRVEYRFIGDQITNGPGWAYRNNGLMLHGQDPAKMAVMQKFPISIEVQLLGGERDRTTLNLCTPGTNVEMNGAVFQNHCTSSSSEKYPGDQWVTVEVEVRGSDFIRHKIDGKTVLEYQKPQLDPRDAKKQKASYGGSPELMQSLIKDGNLLIEKGTISLQSESHPTQFRKIELMKLDPEEDKKEDK
jgi:hypothetical protein